MANFFNLTLDTTAPISPTVSINGGATFTTNQLVNLTVGTGDGNTTGYQMKIWGSVDTSYTADIQGTEGASNWITYATSKQVKVASGEGAKNLYIKIRDDVYNSSGQATDSIILDTSLPEVTIEGVDVSKISKISGKNIASFTFTADSNFIEYKVKVVSSTGAVHDTGVQIGTANGSTNMSDSGSFTASTPVNCTINGNDLELASSGDGTKIIKVFVKESTNLWST